MTIELVTILECALAELDDSDMWFDMYTTSNLESDWQISKEHHMKCLGLLKAYEIMTDKKIHAIQCEIKEKLANA